MKKQRFVSEIAVLILLSSCTGQIPGSFRFLQQEEAFNVSINVNTKLDLLWVVDNSASMDVAQQKLRNGLTSFASIYMQPTWDIRTAVITSDVYLAGSAFSQFRTKTIPGSAGYISNHINNKNILFVNPASNPTLVNPATGAFPSGFKYNDIWPKWDANYAKLLPGYHDGPIPTLCFEWTQYFLLGVTNCAHRDDNGDTTVSKCTDPGAGDDTREECVNTTQNNNIHSGKPIIETKPPSGTPGDAAWVNALVDNFLMNVSVGSSGHGSERPLGSLVQFIADNEASTSTTKFFRENSVRAIIFVSDEEDQTLTTPASPTASFNPYTSYGCDLSGLQALNPAANITGSYCCSNGCTFDSDLDCSAKTIDGFTYTPSSCADPAQLVSVSSVKAQLDNFFIGLDGTTENPNYFLANIIPMTGAGIQQMQADRAVQDAAVGSFVTVATDRPDRLIALANQVGNGSMSMDITLNDYSPLLNQIGLTAVLKAGKFKVSKKLGLESEMIIKIIKLDGSFYFITNDHFEVVDEYWIQLDATTILALNDTDQIVINYQPSANF